MKTLIAKCLFAVAAILGACLWWFKHLRTKIRNYRARHPRHIYPGDPEWEKYLASFADECLETDEPEECKLTAQCQQCSFSQRLLTPPEDGDFMPWQDPDGCLKRYVTRWPYCPQCSNPFLKCAILTWEELKELEAKGGV